MDDDSCPELGLAIQNHFKAIDVRMGKGRHSKHRQSLVTLSRRHSMVQMLDNLDLDGPSPIRKLSLAHRAASIDHTTSSSKVSRKYNCFSSLWKNFSLKASYVAPTNMSASRTISYLVFSRKVANFQTCIQLISMTKLYVKVIL